MLNKLKNNKLYYLYKLVEIDIHKKYSYKKIESYVNKQYKKNFGRNIDWENPKTYNEKLCVSKIYGCNKLKSELTDKITVRNWIKEKIGAEYLIPIIGVYDKFDDIDFEKLPDKFVMKMNNDSGSVYVCEDKTKIDMSKLRDKFNYYIKRNFAYLYFEMHYSNIKPKIIIEKFMGTAINDYKFLCFNGKIVSIRVDYDRFGDHKRNFYDLNWNLLPFNKGNFRNYMVNDKPSNLDEMKSIVEKISSGFDQIRIDLYDINNKVYFGETTFTNGAGLEKFEPDIWDEKIGKMWKFNNNLREKILKNKQNNERK